MHTYPRIAADKENDIGKNYSLNDLYRELVKDIYENGTLLKKRNGTVLKEIIPATIEISNPKNAILTQNYRGYNPAFMIAECIWNLCGDTEEWLADYNEKYRKYFNNGHLIAGYGNRILNGEINQLHQVVKLLKEDPDSSRATISIFDPEEDYKETNFVPCISFLKFRILEKSETKKPCLNMWSFMRAQDIWKGFPYDIFLLLSIFQYVANAIGIEMGSYFHVCDTIRLYKEDFDDIELFLNKEEDELQEGKIEMQEYDVVFRGNDLEKYRDLIKNNVYDEKMLEEIPVYWRNAILTCWVYKNVKSGDFISAKSLYDKISNEFALQIINWSRRYNKMFYDYIRSYI